ncbi:MAG: type II toxin-antitoxin system RelE/ParE family toxin [Rhodothermia bacterium]
MASYKLVIKRSAAKEIESIEGKKTRQRVVERIQELATSPRPHGCEKLSGKHPRYRIRQGPMRILYEIKDEELVVFIVKVADRRDVYKQLT